MKKLTFLLIVASPIFFIGCDKPGLGKDTSYNHEEVFHNEYYYKMKNDPSYKLEVQDLNLVKDLEKGNIFCYDTVDKYQDKYKKVISYLRELPIECDDQKAAVGPVSCMIESGALDSAAKENSALLADGSSSNKTAKEQAQSNGYDGDYVLKDTMTQNNLNDSDLLLMVEKKMKSKSGFCSMVMDKNVLHMGADYVKSNSGKTYWTLFMGDNRK